MSEIKTLVLAGGEIHDYEACGAAMRSILEEDGRFDVEYIENDLSVFKDGLATYDVLAFYYTLGELTSAQKNGLLEWVADGNGYVGVHSAADSFRECPEYR
ncbi:MAG: ThuA domain-containing protein, partial [Planctomycetota bacterium]